jgi:hypothetical protein
MGKSYSGEHILTSSQFCAASITAEQIPPATFYEIWAISSVLKP